MEAAINPSLSFDDSLLKGRPDWIHMLKNWDHQHHTMISIYDTSKDYFIFFNQSVTSILGYRTCHFHQFKAQDWISMIHQKEQSRAVEFLFNTTPSQNGKNSDLQYHIRHKDGRWIYVSHEQNLVEFQARLWIINLIIDITGKEVLQKYLHTIQYDIPGYFPDNLPIKNRQCPLDISKRELEVVRLIGSGFSSKEIADKLFISSHTAITHRKNLIKKFKVKNTAQLIKEAAKHMLLS